MSISRPDQVLPARIRPDNRPSDFEYALLSEHVYGRVGHRNVPIGAYVSTTSGKWTIVRTKRVSSGYFGAIYACVETREMVVAHRGTNSLRDVIENIRGVFFNEYATPQKEAAFSLVREAADLLRTDSDFEDYHLSFTGHSLGAFLAELSVHYAQAALGLAEVNAVTFESPGSRESVPQGMGGNQNRLDIVSYVCYPNVINVCNQHSGTVYSINVELGPLGSWPGIHLLRCHSVHGIVDWFRGASSNPKSKRLYMSDWPVGFWEHRVYFKYARFVDGQYTIRRPLKTHRSRLPEEGSEPEDPLVVIEKYLTAMRRKFKLRLDGNFKIHESLSPNNVLPLHHFGEAFQGFIRDFIQGTEALYRDTSRESKRILVKLLEEKWTGLEMPEEVQEALHRLRFLENSVNMDVVVIDVEGASVPIFRRQLSTWLERVGLSAGELLDIGTDINLFKR